MKLKLTFKKLAQRWFVDIPWIGSIDDLQMVNGVDDFLEWYAAGLESVTLRFDTEPDPERGDIHFHKIQQDEFGATYEWISLYEDVPVPTIWLCNVTKHVCDGDFPSDLYIYK